MSEILVNQMAIEIVEANRLKQVLAFQMPPNNAMQLIGQLQLAARHPGNNGGSATFARSFIEAGVQWFRDRGHVACVTVLERGDDPTFDMDSDFHVVRTKERVEVLQECVRLLKSPADVDSSMPVDRVDTFLALQTDIREARGDLIEAFDRYKHALEQLEALAR